MRLRTEGFTAELPSGWEARARLQPPSRPGRRGNLLVHAATVPMPEARGDFGSGVVDLLGPDDIFVSLFEYDQEESGSELFAARGLPVVRPSDFSPAVLQRTLPGHSGTQIFFRVGRRAFCLHAVLGSHGRRAAGAVRINELVQRVSIGRPG